jgi:type I restriction enzyme, R subunit
MAEDCLIWTRSFGFVNFCHRRQDDPGVRLYTYESRLFNAWCFNVITKTKTQLVNSNFSVLDPYETLLPRLGVEAERYFAEDPRTSIAKLEQFADLLAQRTALSLGVTFNPSDGFLDLINHLRKRGIAQQVLDIFQRLGKDRSNGQDRDGKHVEALHQLKLARALTEWYLRLITNDPLFAAPPFVVPPDSQQVAEELKDQLEELTKRLSSVEYAPKARADDSVDFDMQKLNEQLAKSGRITRSHFRVDQLQLDPAQVATFQISLSEEEATRLIEAQMRIRGWEVDAATLRFDTGARPVRGKNRAIAGWPANSDQADYALFVGTKCVGVVEAKRDCDNLHDSLRRSEDYSRGLKFIQGAEPLSWPCSEFRVPFAFATNGRSYTKGLETETGIWFRDLRLPAASIRAFSDWPTPEGLMRFYEVDQQQAHAILSYLPFEPRLNLRPYQINAIKTIEAALKKDRRQMLISMAPGAGKTKTAIALLYRLLSAKRIRNACYVVDGSVLKEQVEREFKTTSADVGVTFADAFGIGQSGQAAKLHVCTIQELLRGILHGKNKASVDQYDLIVLDECHYGLRYREGLEYFDAVKIALTATPSMHTVGIFGDPLFHYSYKDGVLEGYLVDHDPPIHIKTGYSGQNNQNLFRKRTRLDNSINYSLACLPDDVLTGRAYFDSQIGTLDFNLAVAQDLANFIDPSHPGKTLVFARDDAHARILVDQLRRVFGRVYGDLDERAIQRLTIKEDRLDDLVQVFKEPGFPKIIVTDDLLTSGVNLPTIVNVVLVRRISSRILFEQMLGRATLPCEEIGKQSFRIFDAVDLCRQFASISSIKPVAVRTPVSIKQLFEQIQRLAEESHRDLVHEQIIVKLRIRIRELDQSTIDQYLSEAGELPDETLERFLHSKAAETADWLREKPDLGSILDGDSDNFSFSPPAESVPMDDTRDSSRNGIQPVFKTLLQSVRGYLPR